MGKATPPKKQPPKGKGTPLHKAGKKAPDKPAVTKKKAPVKHAATKARKTGTSRTPNKVTTQATKPKTNPKACALQESEDRMELAMDFKLNARNTNWDDKDNTRWLLEAGYKEEDITEEIKTKFKKRYSYFFTRYINHSTPEEEQPWHHHWLRKLDVSQELLTSLSKAMELFPDNKEDAQYSLFERIRQTSIKQRLLSRIGIITRKDLALINTIHSTCNKFFKDLHLPTDFGFDLDYTIIHAIFTDDDTSTNFQDPHTDYPYVITRKNLQEQVRLSWTAHMPISKEGSWITLWWGPGIGYTMHIPYGKILLLRSDVIHGGGIPCVSRKSDKQLFRRLHFYLVTKDQAATPGYIYDTYYDNETKLADMCYQAKRSFQQTK